MKVNFDFSEFNRATRDYLVATGKTQAEVVAVKSSHLCWEAVKQTKKANREKILQDLGAVSVQRVTRTGKVRQGFGFASVDTSKAGQVAAAELSRAAMIILGRALKAGKAPPTGNRLADSARRMIAARVRAVGFVKSGWLAAAKSLGEQAKAQGLRTLTKSSEGIRLRGHFSRGRSLINTSLLGNVSVTIVNNAFGSRDGGGMKYAEQGLKSAIPVIVSDMRTYLAGQLQKTANQFNAK